MGVVITVAMLASLVGARVIGDDSVVLRDVTHDSRQAGPGTLFVAVPGTVHDGYDFIAEAVAAGSPAVVTERSSDTTVPQIVVTEARTVMAAVSAEVHGHPSRRLDLVGVTGTNGKTTVTHMIESIVSASGRVAGLIGTVHTRVGSDNVHNTRTTPEAPDFQRLLAIMAGAGADVVAAEVSSHALALRRVDSTWFSVAAFTNLSQDHLDFHGGMNRYVAAKARLFESERAGRAVIFVDDGAGAELAASIEIPVTTVGAGGDVAALDVESGVEESRFTLVFPSGERQVRLGIGARFNVDNALVAAACALEVGLTLDDIVAGLSSFAGVPGRFEVVSDDDPITVVVDYAHTPAGIEQAIATARSARARGVGRSGRVVVVIGAGGDRDRGKRPRMGQAAASADLVVVTSDNPRSEDPDTIIDQVVAGIPHQAVFERQADRRLAIEWAIGEAVDGDIVLVLGRGHERGQEAGGRSIPFDDRLVSRTALAARREASR